MRHKKTMLLTGQILPFHMFSSQTIAHCHGSYVGRRWFCLQAICKSQDSSHLPTTLYKRLNQLSFDSLFKGSYVQVLCFPPGKYPRARYLVLEGPIAELQVIRKHVVQSNLHLPELNSLRGPMHLSELNALDIQYMWTYTWTSVDIRTHK